MSRLQVIDVTKLTNDGKVVFGATVTIEDLNSDKTSKYKIVGESEANLEMGMLSVTSPLSRAMVGKLEGDEFTFDTPGGEAEYEIMKVEYI